MDGLASSRHKMVRRWKAAAASVIMILLAALVTLPNAGSVQVQAPQPMIIISGDEELASSPLVTAGVGSEEYPFIIEGVTITEVDYWEPTKCDARFVIANTTAHLTIRNVDTEGELHGPFSPQPFFVIWNCANVVVEQNGPWYPRSSFLVANCSHVEFIENRLDAAQIVVDNSTDVAISRNSILWARIAIIVRSSSNVQILDNYIWHSEVGVSLRNSTGVDVSGNTISDVDLDFQDDNTDGANTYTETANGLDWTTDKTVVISAAAIVEVAMAVLAIRRLRTMRIVESHGIEYESEEDAEWKW